jgi:hypothetical protein
MDFIERCLHIAPDGGDGRLEALLFAGIVFWIATAAFRGWARAAAPR